MTRRQILFSSVALAVRRGKIDSALTLIDRQIASGEVSAAAIRVQTKDFVAERAWGKATTPGAVFLLASITKPMTCTAVMTLVDRRELSLSDPVQKFIPEFRGGGKSEVLVRHLLTHTSGLPDMLEENSELRKRHAPLSDFVAGTCKTPLLFPPGTDVRYQSMGILLAADLARRITNRPLPEFLRSQVLEPLKMHKTSLGLGGRAISATMLSQVEEVSDWDWNSSYWRNLAAPWGGAHSNVEEITRFLRYFHHPDARVLKPETAKAMITDQNAGLKTPWGLGWRVGRGAFAPACSTTTFGHYGSTGTLCWLDPDKDLSFVLLTTRPAALSEKTLLKPVSGMIAESI